MTSDTRLDKLIDKCFKNSFMQKEGDTELFDTDITKANIKALISAEVKRAKKQQLLWFIGTLEVNSYKDTMNLCNIVLEELERLGESK